MMVSTRRGKFHIFWNPILSITLTPFWLVPLTLFAAFTALIVGVRLVGNTLPIPPDPFAPYADVFPGQPRSAVTAFGFSCPASNLNPGAAPLSVETCVFWPATGPFAQIIVSISPAGIRQLTFVPGRTSLRMADLIAWWGPPLIEDLGNIRQYDWSADGKHALVHARIEHHNILSPLDRFGNRGKQGKIWVNPQPSR